MAKQKLGFKIHVKEISNGFIVYLENEHGINFQEIFCENRESIIGQIRTWVDELFVERAKQGLKK